MLLEELISQVQYQFGDLAGVQITRRNIINWLNNAQLDIVRKTNVLEKSIKLNVESGKHDYSVPDGFVKLQRVSYDDKTLDAVTLEELDGYIKKRDSEEPSGEPRLFYIWGQKIFLYPSPSSDLTEGLELYYVKWPEKLEEDGDEPEIPEYMHEDMLRYALSRAKEMDEEDGAAQAIMADYEMRVNESRHDAQQPVENSYPAVRTLPGDGGDLY